MKILKVLTKRVVGHDGYGEPIYEEIKQSISPELTINKFLKYLPNQKYRSVEVLEVSDVFNKATESGENQTITNPLKGEVEKYQAKINEILRPKKAVKVDYKAKSEDLEDKLSMMMERLEALESEKPKRGRQPKQKTIDE